jgi:hypothetical protein
MTLWLFREKLAQAGIIERLFDGFDQHLEASGYIARGGQRCHHRAGAQTTEHARGKRGSQEWPNPRGVEEETGQEPAEG